MCIQRPDPCKAFSVTDSVTAFCPDNVRLLFNTRQTFFVFVFEGGLGDFKHLLNTNIIWSLTRILESTLRCALRLMDSSNFMVGCRNIQRAYRGNTLMTNLKMDVVRYPFHPVNPNSLDDLYTSKAMFVSFMDPVRSTLTASTSVPCKPFPAPDFFSLRAPLFDLPFYLSLSLGVRG